MKKVSLNELMGGMGEFKRPLTMKDLPEILGDKMPDIPYDRVGRLRLVNALQQRFGIEYMNIPGVKGIMEDFDTEFKVRSVIKANRRKK